VLQDLATINRISHQLGWSQPDAESETGDFPDLDFANSDEPDGRILICGSATIRLPRASSKSTPSHV
jgi:hypothetical protein